MFSKLGQCRGRWTWQRADVCHLPLPQQWPNLVNSPVVSFKTEIHSNSFHFLYSRWWAKWQFWQKFGSSRKHWNACINCINFGGSFFFRSNKTIHSLVTVIWGLSFCNHPLWLKVKSSYLKVVVTSRYEEVVIERCYLVHDRPKNAVTDNHNLV